jgi:hypothetical protein
MDDNGWMMPIQRRKLMPEVLIENLTFPPKEIRRIEIDEGNTICIYLSDKTFKNNIQYQKWINLCGTMDEQSVEQVSIGKIHYDNEFHFRLGNTIIGIPGKTASEIHIILVTSDVSLLKKINKPQN